MVISKVIYMKCVYELNHKRLVAVIKETDEKVNNTKLLGFFSSKKRCEEAILYYLKQPGFKDFPDDFVISQVKADLNDFNDIPGEFNNVIYYLSHEWYDGEYDIISDLGYYSTYKKAEIAESQYRLEPDIKDHPDGFVIDAYEIDKMEWTEGFVCDD